MFSRRWTYGKMMGIRHEDTFPKHFLTILPIDKFYAFFKKKPVYKKPGMVLGPPKFKKLLELHQYLKETPKKIRGLFEPESNKSTMHFCLI